MKKRLLSVGLLLVLLVSLLLSGCGTKDDDVLVVLNYGKYVEPELIERFEKETGIKVKYEEYESVEDMYAKYSAGSINYDVICTSDYMINTLREEGELIPIDYKTLKNFDLIDEKIIEQSAPFDPTHEYTLPFYYGTVGILYNTKLVSEEEASSWDILWDEKYKNRIIQINSQRDCFLTALMKQGYELNTTNKEELDDALALLQKQKALVYAYLLDETNEAMIAEDAALAVCYSGEAATAMEYNEDLDYIVPSEGSNLWIDSWFIPRTCKHYDAAMKWLDFLNEPDVALINFEYVWYAPPNLSVWENVDKEYLEDITVFPTDDILSNCEVYESYSDELLSYTTNQWKQLKAYQFTEALSNQGLYYIDKASNFRL